MEEEAFGVKSTSRQVRDGDAQEQRRDARRKKATKDQFVKAIVGFTKRIDLKQESSSYSSRDFCKASRFTDDHPCRLLDKHAQGRQKTEKFDKIAGSSREGRLSQWALPPRTADLQSLRPVKPTTRSLKPNSVHDQMPANLLKCWATCLWCVHACLCATLSLGERTKMLRQTFTWSRFMHVAPLERRAARDVDHRCDGQRELPVH